MFCVYIHEKFGALPGLLAYQDISWNLGTSLVTPSWGRECPRVSLILHQVDLLRYILVLCRGDRSQHSRESCYVGGKHSFWELCEPFSLELSQYQELISILQVVQLLRKLLEVRLMFSTQGFKLGIIAPVLFLVLLN